MKVEDQIIEKYRPKTLDDVVGNEHIVKSLKQNLATPSRPHAYLFTGPFGCGKTTFAEILAKELGAISDASIIRVNAGQTGGVDDTRELVKTMSSYPIDGGKAKVLIMDECHELSAKAWSPFLTILESAPDFAYFIFATSEGHKVNDAFKTRVPDYAVEVVQDEVLFDFIELIAESEGVTLDPDIVGLIATNSGGSFRQSLTHFAKVRDMSVEDAKLLIATTGAGGELHETAYNLAELIFKQRCKNFGDYKPVITSIVASPKSSWGSIKSTLLNYGNTNMMFANNTATAANMMAAFNDVKSMQQYFNDAGSLKAELIELSVCACLHLP